ncbi:hypothetical protein F0Q45_03025 [Mycobacterium simiae]|uniref:Uncharacterized protein n=1 Tax=Mycobacterium simiae TaxID=1784 RepID=A0A5B1BWX9_MYCSI|nr:hypothetical protein F0Q45_03025 [Mycobacterium simiae]
MQQMTLHNRFGIIEPAQHRSFCFLGSGTAFGVKNQLGCARFHVFNGVANVGARGGSSAVFGSGRSVGVDTHVDMIAMTSAPAMCVMMRPILSIYIELVGFRAESVKKPVGCQDVIRFCGRRHGGGRITWIAIGRHHQQYDHAAAGSEDFDDVDRLETVTVEPYRSTSYHECPW